MNQSLTESMQISRSCKILLATLLMLFGGTFLSAQQSPPDGVKFEVISITVLSNKEAAERSPDFVGPNIAVRLRLSSSAHGLSFYGWKNSAIPSGYKVQRTEQGVAWFYGRAGAEKKMSSPGLKALLFGSTGEWMTLPPYSAVEWEQLDSTSFAGESHAFTAFIKLRERDEPLEVVSNTFAVPSNATTTTQ